MGGKCSEVKHEVRWTAAKLKITYMHHGRMEMYVRDYKMQRDDEDNWEVVESEHNNQPWWDIASLLHEGTQGEPQAIKNPKVVWRVWGALRVFDLIVLVQMPLIRAEAAHQEEHHTHADIGKNYTHPNLIGQWVQEGKHPRLGLLRLLNHNGDAQAHKGLREVYHFFPYQRYS